ncbi:MAG: D-alanyl-D-alanine carboxypeptidase family protein, partial [Acutalibacteraceae bacterium]
MKKRIFSVFSLILIVFFVFSSFSVTAFAADYGCDVDVKSDTALVVNMDTGTVVYEKNADTKRYPASITKIMTFIVVSEHIDDLKNTKIKIKQDVVDTLSGTGSSLSAVSYNIGKEFSALDMLYCLLVSSGNDAAVVLADYVGEGSIEKFVEMMNLKAKDLDCKNTNFVNPHGLHDKNHYTTAWDLQKITTYALSLPYFAEITNTKTYEINGYYYPTTNYMIDQNRGGELYYTYAKGIKTGTTDEAGRCLVTTAVADGYSYMCILLHAPYSETDQKYYTMIDAADLFRWAFLNIELKQVATKETPICDVELKYSMDTSSVVVCPEKDVNTLLPKNYSEKDVEIKSDVPKTLSAPIEKGDIVGKATVYYQGEKLDTFKLVSNESVSRSNLLYVLDICKNVFTSVWFLLALILAALLLALYIVIFAVHKNNQRKRR